MFHSECIQLLSDSVHRKTKAQCPLCRVPIQSTIPLFLNLNNTLNKEKTESQPATTLPDSQLQQNSQCNRRDALIELNGLLSEKVFELEQSQMKMKQLQSEHVTLVETLNRKHDTTVRRAREEYEALFDASRRQEERISTSEKLNARLTKEVEQLSTEMEDFKALRVCTMVQNMVKVWDSGTVEDQLREERDLTSFARALCLQNRIQFEEIEKLQTQLSRERTEKQVLERKLFKIHSEGHVKRSALEVAEETTNSAPFEAPVIRSTFGNLLTIDEPERSSPRAGPLFRTKGRRQLGNTIPDGMGGRSKVIRSSTDQVIEL